MSTGLPWQPFSVVPIPCSQYSQPAHSLNKIDVPATCHLLYILYSYSEMSCLCFIFPITGEMDPPGYLEDDFSSLDGLDDDVFHSDDCGLASQPSEITFPGIFTQSQSYSCLLGRFQLFPLTHCCGPGTRHAKQQDKSTQTLSPSSSSQDVMLPYGVTEQPQRLFYGKNAPLTLKPYHLWHFGILTYSSDGFLSVFSTYPM